MGNRRPHVSRVCVILYLIPFVVGCTESAENRILLTDDFEVNRLAEFWRPGNKGSGRFESDAVSFTNDFRRSGNYCAKLVLEEGYIRQDGGDGNFTERTELDSRAFSFLNQEVWYKFSLLVPEDFPIVDNRLVISQIKQTVFLKSPIILFAQRFRNGHHYLTIYDMAKSEKVQASRIELPELTKEQWHDFIFQVYYTGTSSGYINMWMNGEKVVSFKGFTASNKGRNQFYHKVGMYRDQWPEPMTLYLDSYLLSNDISSIDRIFDNKHGG